MQQSFGQDAVARKILSFLNENSNNSYTVQEMIEDRYIYSSKQQIQQSLNSLLREGLVRVKNRGSQIAYQVILKQQ